MGLFDWLRRPAKSQAPPAPAALADSGSTFVVPEDHAVQLFRAGLAPGLVRSEGGVWLADLGKSSDESLDEVEKLVGEVEAAMAHSSGATLFAMDGGLLSDFFAPHDPRVVPVERMLLWIGAPHNLSFWLDDPRRMGALLRRLYCLRTSRTHPVASWFYVDEAAGEDAALLASLLDDIGVFVRMPGDEGVLLAEVRRPEGVVISVLAGELWFAKPPEESPLLALQRARDEAEMLGDAERLRQLEQQESALLTQRIYGSGRARVAEPVARAPKLRRLLLESMDTGEMRALHEELRQRDIPFFVLTGPTGGISPRAWGDVQALAANADLVSMQQTVRDMKLQPGSYRLAVLTPRDLFKMASQNGVGVALNVYRDAETPCYVLLDLEAVRALEKGAMPGGV